MTPARREWVNKQFLVTAKGYPNISSNFRLGEVCCIAGLTEEREWVRIWPVLYRDLPPNQRPRKYEIISVRAFKYKDPRPESFHPDESTIEKLRYLDVKKDEWKAAKDWVIPAASESMCEIRRLAEESYKSLGLFKPREVADLTFEDDETEWTPQQLRVIRQGRLFGAAKTPLEKIPLKFRYRYYCADPKCPGHHQTIIDWEICELYRKLRDKYGGDITSIKRDIKMKFLDELCGPRRDTYFFVGDMHWHPGSFIILGLFWPPKSAPTLFDHLRG
jgi:hypothetical protein